MSTLNSPMARAARLAVPLLAAGALAAGCGSVSASSSAASGGAVHSTVTATPVAPVASATSAAPVPTVSGGSPAAGGVACVGWPSGTVSGALPATFVPVSVERCVNGATTVPGKGLWTSATLQRSTGDLSRLVNALRQPTVTRKPGTICPALAMIPPQVVLVDAAGEKLVPRLPLGECGLTASAVLSALDALSWQPVSVRLIARVSGGAAETTPATATAAPHPTQTASGGRVQPQ